MTAVACPVLSFGSNPALRHARDLSNITEARCGNLFHAGNGACKQSNIPPSALTTVIGANPSLNRFTIDAGGLALSKDRSTQGRPFDAGFGLVCDEQGEIIPILHVATVSQELGLVATMDGSPAPFARFPVGTRPRILPNHTDMAAAVYAKNFVVDDNRKIIDLRLRKKR